MNNNKSIYQFNVKTLRGDEVSLSEYKGKSLIIVNTATECGQAPQLKILESIYQQYKNQGLEILAFPSNQFSQEPLEGKSISEFCEINYGVTFKIFDKIYVRGENAHPLFKFLSSKKLNGKFSAKPWWNFYKYIIDRNGNVVDYFYFRTYPNKKRVIRTIEKALASPNPRLF